VQGKLEEQRKRRRVNIIISMIANIEIGSRLISHFSSRKAILPSVI
jgi:hypothetical protein